MMLSKCYSQVNLLCSGMKRPLNSLFANAILILVVLHGIAMGQQWDQPILQGAATLQGPSYVTTMGLGTNQACMPCVQTASSERMIVQPGPQPTGVSSGACEPCIHGVDCACTACKEGRWTDAKLMDFQPLMHGEFIGPIRLPALLQYRVRLGDEIEFIYVLSRQRIDPEYRLQVGDELMIASMTDPTIKMGDLTKGIAIQSDGKLHLQLLTDPMQAAGLTIPQLRKELEQAFLKYLKKPAIDVQPVATNTRLRDLQNSVDSRFGSGGQVQRVVVNPDGRVNLQLIGSVYVYGLTLDDIRREVNLRYAERVTGIEIEPRLSKQAQHFVYVFGEVAKPGRFEITSPTSVTMALAMAEGIKNGGNHRQVVILRRADDWRMLATKLDLRGEHLGRRPTPSDEIWLRDSDLVIVPPTPVKVFDNLVEQVFTQGIYRVVPFAGFSIQSTQ